MWDAKWVRLASSDRMLICFVSVNSGVVFGQWTNEMADANASDQLPKEEKETAWTKTNKQKKNLHWCGWLVSINLCRKEAMDRITASMWATYFHKGCGKEAMYRCTASMWHLIFTKVMERKRCIVAPRCEHLISTKTGKEDMDRYLAPCWHPTSTKAVEKAMDSNPASMWTSYLDNGHVTSNHQQWSEVKETFIIHRKNIRGHVNTRNNRQFLMEKQIFLLHGKDHC